MMNANGTWNVDRILGSRVTGTGALQYRVAWEGWALEDATWEDEEDVVEGAAGSIAAFHASLANGFTREMGDGRVSNC
jgi:hypothetical protein